MINFRKYTQLNEAYKVPKKPISGDAINVFDIDDTLIITSAVIKVFDPTTGEEFSLTAKEYNEFEQLPHHELDFTDFDDMEILKNGQLIEWVVRILRKTIAKGKAVGIITARSADKKLLSEFFKHHGINIHPDLIFSVNDPTTHYTGSNAERKQMAFEELIEMGYKDFKFFDDDLKNLQYAKDLEKKHSEISMTILHIQPKWRPNMTEAYADRILEKNETHDEITKMWALTAHISDFFVKAKTPRELMDKFIEARKKSNDYNAGWNMDSIKYFYNWHLDRIKDKKREEKAELMQVESLQYYNKNILL